MNMDYVKLSEAAKLLSCTERTIYNYIDDGLLTLYKVRKNKSVLLRTQVLKLLEPIEAGRNE